MMFTKNFRRFFGKALRQPLYALGILRKRIAARLFYGTAGGRSASPEAITLFLTHKCNLHCRMCGQWGDGGVTKKAPAGEVLAELPYDAVKALVDEVSAYRPSITLFGGEPLLHSRALDIIKYVKSKGMHCVVITNGSLIGPMAAEIVSSGLDELNVSLDAAERLHDEIRGMPGLFGRIMSGLKEVRRLKAENGLRKPLVNIQCTMSKYNYMSIDRMPDVAAEAGADTLTFHNLIFTDRKTIDDGKGYEELLGSSSAEWEGFVFPPEIDPAALDRKIRAILSAKHPFAVDMYPNFSGEGLERYYSDPYYGASGAGLEYPRRCLSPWIAAYVFPDGEVRPCLNSTYSFGNIKSRSFGSIWNGAAAAKFRRELKKAGIFPLCVRCTELYRY